MGRGGNGGAYQSSHTTKKEGARQKQKNVLRKQRVRRRKGCEGTKKPKPVREVKDMKKKGNKKNGPDRRKSCWEYAGGLKENVKVRGIR